MPPVLELSGVTRSYRGRIVLKDFSLRVAAGEAAIVLGDNGAGKSTALKIAAGELAPTSGFVKNGGGDPRDFAVRRRTAYLSETDALESFLSVDEAVRYLLDLYGVRREKEAQAGEILARFGLDGALRKKRTAQLSKGQRRRLELARIRLVDPPLWILDEPDSGLDPAGLAVLRAEIRAACGRGRAVVFSSHALSDVSAADRIVVLRAGSALFDGTHSELADRLGAQGFVVKGGPNEAALLCRTALAAGLVVEGPELPLSALEGFLFGGSRIEA